MTVSWEEISRPAPAADARIAYGPDPLMFGDLRLPAGVARPPVAVVIHGGCWRAENDLAHASHLAEALRAAGMATWTLEYRRIGNAGGGWPGTFQDAIAGVNHVRELARQYDVDIDRTVLVGHSAGGHLALWLASHAGRMDVHPDLSALRVTLRGVVSLAGITDLHEFSRGDAYCNASVPPLLGGTPTAVPDRYDAASPLAMTPPAASVLLVHGGRDAYVPRSQPERYRDRFVGVTLDFLEDAGHFDLIAPWSPHWRRIERQILAAAHTPDE